jgi:hypothetical protein
LGKSEEREQAMTVLADFNIIIHEDLQGVGVRQGERSPLGTRFNTGGRLGENSGQTGPLAAFIMFSVLNLQIPLDVFVNGDDPIGDTPIGTMDPNPPGAPGWNSQVLCMSGSRLKSGDGNINEISVALPPGSPVATAGFQIKNLICFYHQDSD